MTIYNENDLRIVLDDGAVTIYNFDERVIEMTEAEFENIMRAYKEAK